MDSRFFFFLFFSVFFFFVVVVRTLRIIFYRDTALMKVSSPVNSFFFRSLNLEIATVKPRQRQDILNIIFLANGLFRIHEKGSATLSEVMT